jgi:phosphatidylinositol alpha-mannosyltransferase
VEVIGPNPDGTIEGLRQIGCGRSRMMAFGGTQIDLTWAGWRQVAQVAGRGYDVMHFHTLWNPLFPLQLAALFPGPKVATFHDAAGPNTPIWARKLMPLASAVLRKLWLRQVIAVSALAGCHLRPDSFHLIPNGLLVPTPLPPEGARQALLFLGRLEPRKGLATLLRALRLLGPNAPALWVAGDGYLRSQLEEQAAGLPVEFLGEVSEAQKWSLLRRARLLIAPSTGGESFGIVLIEAMACGTPPVAADNPGYREVLKEQGPALIFPVDDEAALASLLHRLLHQADEVERLRAWGEQQWRRYDWRQLAQTVEKVYLQASNPH